VKKLDLIKNINKISIKILYDSNKQVLKELASFYNCKEIYPSLKTIAQNAGIRSEKTVRISLRWLEKNNFIKTAPNFIGKKQTTNIYTLNVEFIEKLSKNCDVDNVTLARSELPAPPVEITPLTDDLARSELPPNDQDRLLLSNNVVNNVLERLSGIAGIGRRRALQLMGKHKESRIEEVLNHIEKRAKNKAKLLEYMLSNELIVNNKNTSDLTKSREKEITKQNGSSEEVANENLDKIRTKMREMGVNKNV